MPWADREFKQNVVSSIRLLRKTGSDLINQREIQMSNGETVPEDILTQVCRYKGTDWLIGFNYHDHRHKLPSLPRRDCGHTTAK